MFHVSFTVPAIPVAQPRQRHAVSRAGFVTNYTPAKHPVNSFKASVKQSLYESYRGPPVECAVKMSITAVFPRPKGKIWKTKEMPRYAMTKKPDVDNVIKSILDSLNGLLYRDDAQVFSIIFEKVIASGEEQPHVTIQAVGYDD